MQRTQFLNGLYGINNESMIKEKTIFKNLSLAIKGGMKIFQYRDKISKDDEIKNLILEIQHFCSENNVLFVLNDRANLAMKLNIGAIHLGMDDMQIQDFDIHDTMENSSIKNKIFSSKKSPDSQNASPSFDYIRKNFHGIIGVSAYNDENRAKYFASRGADYVAFGAMFKSRTKANALQCDINIIDRFKECKDFKIANNESLESKIQNIENYNEQNLNIKYRHTQVCAIGGINLDNAKMLKKYNMIAVIEALWSGDILQNARILSAFRD